jgi:hypothetical protein
MSEVAVWVFECEATAPHAHALGTLPSAYRITNDPARATQLVAPLDRILTGIPGASPDARYVATDVFAGGPRLWDEALSCGLQIRCGEPTLIGARWLASQIGEYLASSEKAFTEVLIERREDLNTLGRLAELFAVTSALGLVTSTEWQLSEGAGVAAVASNRGQGGASCVHRMMPGPSGLVFTWSSLTTRLKAGVPTDAVAWPAGIELQNDSGQKDSRPKYASVLRDYWSQRSGDDGSVGVGWSTAMLTMRQNKARHQLARNHAISLLPAAAMPRKSFYER